MARENSSLAEFDAKDDVPEEQSREEGALVVNARWLLTDRYERGVKARVVAQEINDGSIQDTYAATPTNIGARVLLCEALRRGWPVMLGDVSTAFLHAALPEGSKVYVIPPICDRQPGMVWKMKKA
eukprot:14264541-Heterocapsa_arctica.AAC.1